MRRRALLASLSTFAAFSGCSSLNRETSPDDRETTTTRAGTRAGTTTGTTTTEDAKTTSETKPATPDPGYPRFVDTVSVDGTDYPGLSFDVSVETARIDADQTATLSASLENTSESSIDLEMGYNPPFSTVRCEDGGYLLVEPGTAGEVDACWEQDHYPGRPALLTKPTLDPGESLTNEMLVLGDPTTDACLPTGEFRFVGSFDVVENGDREGRANAVTLQFEGD